MKDRRARRWMIAGIVLWLIWYLAGCVGAPHKTPYAEADVDLLKKQVGDIELRLGKVEGIAIGNAENIQAIRDVAPRAGRDAFTIVERGGAWAVVVAVLGLTYLRIRYWKRKSGEYQQQRDGLVRRLKVDGAKTRQSDLPV